VDDKRRADPVRRIVVQREGKVKRAQKGRQRHMAWREGRLKPWQARVGPSRWTKKRIQHDLQKVWQQYPQGQWDKVTLSGFGKHARERRGDVDRAKRQETTLLDGMSALVTTLPAEPHTTAQVFQLFTEPHDVERSNHLLKGHLRVSPVYLKKPMRLEGRLFMLWMALVADRLIARA
jgi:transposase